MKKFYVMLASALLGAGSLMAQAVWQTQKLGEVKVDTLYHATVGPGTTQTQLQLSYGNDRKSKVTYTTTDLTNEYVTIKSGVASQKSYGKPQRPDKMMSDRTSYQKHYFVGINGDFAGLESTQSIPCGALIENGSYVTPAATLTGNIKSNYLVIDKDGMPTIAADIEYNHSKTGTVLYPSGAVETELTLNDGRWDECVIAYNEYYGYPSPTGCTKTNQWGNEAELLPVETNTIYGNEAEFRVNSTSTAGNMKIPNGGLVLSGVGSKRTDGKIDALKVGDVVKIKFPFKADGVETSARELLGGWGITVKDGVVQSLPSKVPSDIAANIPRARTAVGYSADRTKFVMAVVQEENSKGANGMTIVEFGDVLASLGCNTALNLDGGGSTVMFVENLGQRSAVQGSLNGYVRPVANGLFAVTDAPEDREVARIEFVDKALTIQPGRGYQPVIYAYNKYGLMISKGLQNYTLSAPEATFDATKRKMIAPESGYFALTAEYNGITASIPVKVDATGAAGSDPDAAPSFSGNEIIAAPEKPADWVDPDQPNLYICGDFQNWGFTDPMIVRPWPGKNHVYEFDIDFTTSKDQSRATFFKMTTIDPRTNGGSAAFANAAGAWHINNAVGNEYPEILGNGLTLSVLPGNENNISTPWSGVWHFVLDLNEKTITASTETPRPAIDTPEHVYLIGDVNGGKIELVGLDGVYKASDVSLTADDMAQFAFMMDNTGYGAYMDGIEIEGNDVFYVGNNRWSITPGNYDITLSLNTFKVSVAPHLFAELEDVTPAGYDFDKYEVGTVWKFAELPASSTSGTWTAPAGIYKQENMDADGHVTALHFPGTSMEGQSGDVMNDRLKAFTIQKHPVDLVGNCLVFAQNYSPGAYRCDWPCATINTTQPLQMSFYADPNEINGVDAEHPVRFRMVFQILYRGRHAQPGKTEVTNVYASACANSAWAVSHNGVSDNEVGNLFPVHHNEFYRWENEGTTVAEIPEEKILAEGGAGVIEPWDVNPATKEPIEQGQYGKPHLINSERFVVYEYDFYGKPDNGTLAVHLNFGAGDYATYVFKEIKFFNVLNGEELLGTKSVRSRAANVNTPFVTTTAQGSLLGTRSISYRYYTPEGVKEIEAEKVNTGIDDVVVDMDETDAPVEYYNLQGMRVENPAAGIYVKRQGSKVSKVLVR